MSYVSLKQNLCFFLFIVAPSGPPNNVRAIEVTNTSITVSWNPPLFLNGVLKYYLIYWNNNSSRVEDKSAVVTVSKIILNSL